MNLEQRTEVCHDVLKDQVVLSLLPKYGSNSNLYYSMIADGVCYTHGKVLPKLLTLSNRPSCSVANGSMILEKTDSTTTNDSFRAPTQNPLSALKTLNY